METRAVSYQAYSAAAFESTSLRSIFEYVHSIRWDHSSRGWRSYRVFIGMILASFYVVSMPTLFSAMTGHAALFAPSLELPPAAAGNGAYNCQAAGGCSILSCGAPGDETDGEGLVPGWGVVIDSQRSNEGSPWTISLQDAWGSKGIGDAFYLRQYYERYAAAYQALTTDPARHNISGLEKCPATNIASTFTEPDFLQNLEAPLLDIQFWGYDTSTGAPEVWLCQNLIINAHDLHNGNVTGICNAAPNVFTGTSYQWGFSFLLLLIVCVLNLVFAVLVYSLWIDARRNSRTPIRRERWVDDKSGIAQWRVLDYPSRMQSVMHIAAQAVNDHGGGVLQWDSRKLNKKIWQGKAGIRARKLPVPGCTILGDE